MPTPEVVLPELPNGAYGVYDDYYDGTSIAEPHDRWHDIELFSADQMRAFATQAVLDERERCAKIVEGLPADDPTGPWFNDDMSSAALLCAAAIRNQ